VLNQVPRQEDSWGSEGMSPQILNLCTGWKWVISYTITHSRNWALLGKPSIVQLLRNFPAFYGTQMFITAFTRALHWSLSWARWILSISSHPFSLRFVLPTTFHLRLGLPSGLFPSSFANNILYAFLIVPIHATFPAHIILLDLNVLLILGSVWVWNLVLT
jgi:hypothetical protein